MQPLDRPLIVVEGPEGAAGRDVTRLRRAGFEVTRGFAPARRASGRLVCHGAVSTTEEAGAALLAALAGHGLVVEVREHSEIADRLVDDLRRLGPVDHRVAPAGATAAIPAEARAVLALLAEGLTLGEAAADLGISRRTADRRVAEARRALGAERTTEAIGRARRLGWLAVVRDGPRSSS